MLSRKVQRYHGIVRTAEGVARLQPGEILHISIISRYCGVSERTLRNAFFAVCGKTPYRHLREIRMNEARLALQSADPASTTVTAVATRFGFYELGRFSVEYRCAYGESPSETLRRSMSGDLALFRRRRSVGDVNAASHVS
jgi:transcriptional regulator GlxA family with amidase domain